MIAQDLKEAVAERFWIQVKNHENDKEISNILEQYKGPIPVIIRYEEEGKTVVSTRHFVRKDSALEGKIRGNYYENDLSLKIRKIEEFSI